MSDPTGNALRANATATAVERFKGRIVEMMDEGCTMFHLSVGPGWNACSLEEKCEATLQMWDAKKKRLDFQDSYRKRPTTS